MTSDEALYEALLEGDVRAFDALYARYERPLYGFIRKHLDVRAEAEDVLHEAFMALLRDTTSARRARSLRAWLFGAARHLCLNRQRSRRREQRALDAEARSVTGAEVAPPDHALARQQQAHALTVAVAKLPVELGELYQLRTSGLSYVEIATVLSVPVGTVKSRMHQMVSRLREELYP